MAGLEELFDRNRAWAAEMVERDPAFFTTLAEGQTPRYLWVGCSDSRVPANQIVGLAPGDVFVHRNVANVVVLPRYGEAVYWHEAGRFEQRLHGQHGGLSPQEMEIPLVAWVA